MFRELARLTQDRGTDSVALEMAATIPGAGDQTPQAVIEQMGERCGSDNVGAPGRIRTFDLALPAGLSGALGASRLI